MRWILDDGPFGTLADLATLRELGRYPPGKLVVAPTTAHEASRSAARSELLGTKTREGEAIFHVFEIVLQGEDPAEAIFLDLHREEETSVNRAERESIAWSLAHADDAVLVTADKRAALTALAELGRGRVAHPFDLWMDLVEARAVKTSVFRRLCERTKARDLGLERMPTRVRKYFEPA